jgi:hypothetical protein
MSKNKNLGSKKEEQKKAPKAPAAAPKVAEKPAEKKVEKPAAKKEEKVEEAQVIAAAAMNPETILNRSGRRGGLSPDATVQALDLAHRVFVEERDPDLQFPKETAIKVNKIVAVGILCTLADHATNGEDSFAAVLNTQAYPSLASAAEDLGFKIPDIKALPAGTAEGTVMLPAKEVKIPKETKEKLKEEKKTRDGEKPELDPTKIDSEEGVKKALEYIFTISAGKRLPDLLTNAIDFMKKFREHEAELAENTEEAKAKFANYNAGDWLDDAFGYFKPTVFFTGIGRGMASVTDIEKSPIHAFVIFREAIKSKETGEPVLDDQEIAYCVKSIMKWVCNMNIESNQKAIDNLDKEKNKSEIEKCEAQIQKYNDILAYIASPSSEEIDVLLDNIGSKFDDGGQLTPECQKANKLFNLICKTYYGKELSGADYKNLNDNIKQYGYHIINLFRAPGERLVDVGLINISDLEERSEEEREAAIKEAKKAWADRKAKQKEEETKNA